MCYIEDLGCALVNHHRIEISSSNSTIIETYKEIWENKRMGGFGTYEKHLYFSFKYHHS